MICYLAFAFTHCVGVVGMLSTVVATGASQKAEAFLKIPWIGFGWTGIASAVDGTGGTGLYSSIGSLTYIALVRRQGRVDSTVQNQSNETIVNVIYY